jgi:hypothetical protein
MMTTTHPLIDEARRWPAPDVATPAVPAAAPADLIRRLADMLEPYLTGKCPSCHGTGREDAVGFSRLFDVDDPTIPCSDCGGDGKTVSSITVAERGALPARVVYRVVWHDGTGYRYVSGDEALAEKLADACPGDTIEARYVSDWWEVDRARA